jgi:hypothetical protein
MPEVQHHGFSFEKWVRNALFDGYEGSYMQKWDIPPEVNKNPLVPPHFHYVPVSVKTAKYGSPIGLGDIIRQRSISESFLMIVGFWRQRSSTEKWIEDIGAVLFSSEEWNLLWGHLSLESILLIDERIKDLDVHYTKARAEAKEWKRTVEAPSLNKIVVNPKIDSKTQRRIQCSLPFTVFWDAAGRPAQPNDAPSLFGVNFSNPIISSPRTFNRE